MFRSKRILLFASMTVVGLALVSLVYTSFTGALVYFYTPSEILAKASEMANQRVRIGGMVQAGSLTRTEGTLKIAFEVTDGKQNLPVRYEGNLPDLFREGQGVVIEGIWKPGETMSADTILAKHSEDYVPVEMSEEGIAKARQSLMKSLQ